MLLLLLPLLVTANINVITFDTPGNYQLTPVDYQYSPQIIVEMWGAGGGGCSGDCGIGGGSGAYIKATINTNLETFNLTIGLGGKGGNACDATSNMGYDLPWYIGRNNEPRYRNLSGLNGTDTILMSTSNNIIAGGGRNGNFTATTYRYGTQGGTANPNRYNGGIYTFGNINGIINIALNGYSGSIGSNKFYGCYQNLRVNPTIIAGIGGNSPYGMIGGLGNNYTLYNSCDYCNLAKNGSTPGSGGGGSYYNYHQNIGNQNCPVGTITLFYPAAGDGGNGTINIYYQYNPTQSSSRTISPTATRSYIMIENNGTTVSPTTTNYPVSYYNDTNTISPIVIKNYTESSIEIIYEYNIIIILIAAIIIVILILTIIILLCVICLRGNVYVNQSIQMQNIVD